MKSFFTVMAILAFMMSSAQVKIGDNPNTINPNSLLEMEATDKGFLPPRVALNSVSSIAPLSGTVPAGMLVYSAAGSLPDGIYYWSGAEWKMVSAGPLKTVTKTANAQLNPDESFVLASNDITITLPEVTTANNGLVIIVSNNGSHTDYVTVNGNNGALIDGITEMHITSKCAATFIAFGGHWVSANKIPRAENFLDVTRNSSWTNIGEAIEFLEEHMSGPAVIRLGDGAFELDETVVIDLPYSVTIQGLSYGSVSISAAAGLTGKPMFRCISDVYFKMLDFDATSLAGYGTAEGEDAIRLLGEDSYNEIKDCSFTGFYNAVLDSSNAELWMFECDVIDAQQNGILLHSDVAGATVKVAETDFINCARGINLQKGSGATIQFASGGYYNANATDTAIIYNAEHFVDAASISIKGNLWNNIGKYIEGFDFTRVDGRDADVILEGNAGMGDKRPYCFINVINSSTSNTLTTSGVWYKADWGSNTHVQTCKWTIDDNQITYQPTNHRSAVFSIAGNLSTDNLNRVISIAIVKNGQSTVRFGETTLRVTAPNQPFQFSFLAYLEDIAPGDYFEVYYSSANGNDVIRIQDLQWLVNSQ